MLPLRLIFCAVPVLPAIVYGAPIAIARPVPPGPCMVAIMPSCTARRLSALSVMRAGAGCGSGDHGAS